MTISQAVGLRVARLRIARDETQREVAQRIGMAPSYYSALETGRRKMSLRMLIRVTEGLGVSLEEFFDSDLFEPPYHHHRGNMAPRKPS